LRLETTAHGVKIKLRKLLLVQGANNDGACDGHRLLKAKKWGQKDWEKTYFFAPIFLPFLLFFVALEQTADST
jgi:hypothetical protein